MAWSKGQPWRAVDSLQVLNAQVREFAPRAVPPATAATAWGSIADSAHSSSSDHFPHFYAALGKTAVVCARDFPHAPALGLDFGKVAEALRKSRDPRIKYVIFGGRMFSSYAAGGIAAFTWRSYSGSDKHWDHGHVSTVSTAAADDRRPWALPATPESAQAGDDDMANTWTEPLTQGPPGIIGQARDNAIAYIWEHAHNARMGVARLEAAAAADEVRDKAMLAAIQGLTSNGGPDAAPIIKAVEAVRDEARQRFTELAEANAKQAERLARIEAGVRAGLSSAELNELLAA